MFYNFSMNFGAENSLTWWMCRNIMDQKFAQVLRAETILSVSYYLKAALQKSVCGFRFLMNPWTITSIKISGWCGDLYMQAHARNQADSLPRDVHVRGQPEDEVVAPQLYLMVNIASYIEWGHHCMLLYLCHAHVYFMPVKFMCLFLLSSLNPCSRGLYYK